MSKSNTATKSNGSLFRIHVRPDSIPTPAKIGRVKDNEFTGETHDVEVNAPIQYIPNFYEARVMKIEKNGAYRGDFKFYSELTEEEKRNATLVKIDVRYVTGTDSLDRKWQDENGFAPATDEEKIGWPLQSGKIAEWEKDKAGDAFIRFMRNHEGCADNPDRDSENSVLFKVIDAAPMRKNLAIEIEEERKLSEFKQSVIDESDLDTLRSYALVFGVNPKYDLETLKVELISKFKGMKNPLETLNNYKAWFSHGCLDMLYSEHWVKTANSIMSGSNEVMIDTDWEKGFHEYDPKFFDALKTQYHRIEFIQKELKTKQKQK